MANAFRTANSMYGSDFEKEAEQQGDKSAGSKEENQNSINRPVSSSN